MSKIRVLIKVGLYTLIYSFIYYFLPLPEPAFLGFLFPLVYIYVDLEKVKHIQWQYSIGFFVAILISILLTHAMSNSFYFGFTCMSFILLFCLYFSCFDYWLRTPFIIIAAVSSMVFNLLMGGDIVFLSSIFEKFILSICLSFILFMIIDLLIGQSSHEYLPKNVIQYPQLKISHYFAAKWEYLIPSIYIYLAVMVVLALQINLRLPSTLCALASASIIVVFNGAHVATKSNILLRIFGAISGILLAAFQLLIINSLPFFFVQIALLFFTLLFFSYLILTYQSAAKFAPQACITYLMVVIVSIDQSDQLEDAAIRALGILMGVVVAYFFSLILNASKKKIIQ